MENVECLFCHDTNYRVLYDGLPDLLTGAPGQFRLVICNDCQLVYLNPRPTATELGLYYPDNYEPFLKIAPQTMNLLNRWFLNYGLRKRARPVLRHREAGRILDIGCATGQYLDYLKSHSRWEVFGVELDASAAEFARKYFNLDVHIGDLKSAHFQDEYFDAITMWDVLEHLTDPFETLTEIRRILKPDGILLLKVPARDSLDAQLFGPYWAGLDVPRHFYVYSRKTLIRLLTEAGFQPLRQWSIAGSFFSFAISLQFWLEAHFGRSKATVRIIKLFRTIPARLLTFPYFYIVGQLSLDAHTTVLSIKSSTFQDGLI